MDDIDDNKAFQILCVLSIIGVPYMVSEVAASNMDLVTKVVNSTVYACGTFLVAVPPALKLFFGAGEE